MTTIKARHVAAGVGVWAFGTYVGILVQRALGPAKEVPPLLEPGEGAPACRFDALAPDYDAKLGRSEWLTGIEGFRRKLLRGAQGRTLEVAAGTGRNLDFYPAGTDLVLSDVSASMLAKAKEKALSKPELKVRVGVLDASKLPFEDGAFDSVVDTFGLCSMPDPEAVLSEMVRVCKPEGCVLLLEHGRSSWNVSLLNKYLDNQAADHVRDWGCLWNRDIAALVANAPGVTVEEEHHHHFGTTYAYVLRKRA